jgi:hypothetical protein
VKRTLHAVEVVTPERAVDRALPDELQLSLGEIAGAAKEGLLALATAGTHPRRGAHPRHRPVHRTTAQEQRATERSGTARPVFDVVVLPAANPAPAAAVESVTQCAIACRCVAGRRWQLDAPTRVGVPTPPRPVARDHASTEPQQPVRGATLASSARSPGGAAARLATGCRPPKA